MTDNGMACDSAEMPAPPPLPVVALGGSAGSLEALQEFFDHVSVPAGMAFVVVTHLHPGRTSILPELLARHTTMPVVAAENATRLHPDRVYVAVPDGELSIEDGVLYRVRADDTSVPHHPVDRFFRALAEDCSERAVGVVLSGTGSDGTLGLKAIKAQGGATLVQDPATASFDGMPSSALATQLADYLLPPGDMPEVLARYAEALRQRASAGDGPVLAVAEAELAEIFRLLRSRTGHDFSSYKRSTLYRRIDRRMRIHRIDSAPEYVRFLRDNPQEIDLLFREIVISVTAFFRDSASWTALIEEGLRARLQAAPAEGREFRAWVVGCATGEEAYTLAIVLFEEMERMGIEVPLQIFATDVDDRAIRAARAGVFPAGIADDLPPGILDKYFTEEGDRYRINKAIRGSVVFAVQNVIDDPPFTHLDLVTCRNLLIYLQPDLQKKLLPKFHYALAPDGLLFLGASESAGTDGRMFALLDKRAKIFRRREAAGMPYSLVDIAGPVPTVGPRARRGPGKTGTGRPADFTRVIERLLAGRFAPPTAVVNDSGRIVYVHGRTGRFLEPAVGLPDNDIVDMAREGLRAPLADALRRVVDADDGTVETTARVRTNGDFETVALAVRRVDHPETVRGLRLVSFVPGHDAEREASVPAGREPVLAGPAEGVDERIRRMEQVMRAARADHQATVDRLETSNEELQSTNEELQSTNEELQSSNEELETSKEEMESLNEELQTVNAELERKVQELAQVNDDMQNLLNSTRIPTIFLDTEFRIRRFTDEARRLVALRPGDVGRPLGELQSYLRYGALAEDGRHVLDTLEPVEREIQDARGQWYLLRIGPYRTVENVIDGLVVTFVDIQPVKAAVRREEFFSSIVETVREPLVVLDEHHDVVMANNRFYELCGMRKETVEHVSLFELGHGQWDIEPLRHLLDEILPGNESFEAFELTARFDKTGTRHLVLNARKLRQSEGEAEMILLAMEDVTRGEETGHGGKAEGT